jgi:serine/threonine protein kinase/Flp pilus assembly protein TadD
LLDASSQMRPPSEGRKFSESHELASVGTGLQPGDNVLGFELVEELGQGAFARVFLARQQSLAGRPVALKVTLRPTREPERLARLQHTNIVPVYSVHSVPGVQVICMPYLGRRTIADLIRLFRDDHPSRQISRKTAGTRPARTTAFTDVQSTQRSTPGSDQTPRLPNPAAGGSSTAVVGDPDAVLRLISQLAAGLAHAHERGILHLDLKPANVLLADTGEPMLLDFNLSFDASNPERELVGGTVPYMATEQLLDLRSRGKGQIDARTDLYSLGVMAYEMLTGTVPFPASYLADIDGLIAVRRKGPPSLREKNPLVSPAVASIIEKLLAPEPADRYQSAEDLRTDIERHLQALPLRHARERSFRERIGKWRRRNPGLPAKVAAACLLGLTLGLGGVAQMRAEENARARAIDRVKQAQTTLDGLRLDLAVPGDPAARAHGIAKGLEVLESYGLPGDAGWMNRADVKRLPERERTTLAADLGEVLLLLAQARWEEARGLAEEQRLEGARVAWGYNRAARHCFPEAATPLVLEKQARELAGVLDEEAPAVLPREEEHRPTARELFLEATSHLARGRYLTAVPLLERATAEQPSHGAAHFCLAYCRQQLGQYQQSLERYDVARVLVPTDPRPAFHRGLIYALMGKSEQAEGEFTLVIERDREHGPAYRNRAVMRFLSGKNKEAEQDLTKALACGREPAIQLHLLRAEVRARCPDPAGAAEDREAAGKLTPQLEGDFIVRGLTRIPTDPRAALADFQAAAAINPRSLQALQNQASVLVDKFDDLPKALDLMKKVVEFYPEYAPARSGRAIVLARMGKRKEAHEEIQKALVLTDDASVAYTAACVYARTSPKNAGDRDRALDHLRKALKEPRYIGLCRSDRDLDAIRDLPAFAELVKAASILSK